MRTALAVVLFTAVVFAAPVPKASERQKIEAAFGRVVDPKGDSQFSLDGDKLVVTLPAKETRGYGFTHDTADPLNPAKFKKTNTCPRVEFDTAGDFTLTVRVKLTLDVKAKSVGDGRDFAYLTAGVQVLTEENDWLAFGPAQSVLAGKAGRDYSAESPGVFSEGIGTLIGETTPVPDELFIRLEREGKRFTFSTSEDGKAFTQKLHHCEGPEADKLKLALVTQHSSDTAHRVTFDQFKVEKK